MKDLIRWIKENNIKTPVQIELQLDRIGNCGKSNYYMAKIAGHNVSQLLAEILNLKVSREGAVYGDMIVPSSEADIGLWVQRSLWEQAKDLNEEGMFDSQNYILINNFKPRQSLKKLDEKKQQTNVDENQKGAKHQKEEGR